MKKIAFSVVAAATLMVSSVASAGWFGGNNSWNDYYDDNDWPEWTPMYWMEEMMDEWDNDDDDYRYGGYGYAPRYGYAPAPYYPAPAVAPRAPAPAAPAAQ